MFFSEKIWVKYYDCQINSSVFHFCMHYGSEKLLDPEKHIVFNKLSRLCNIHISHSYGKL